MYNFESIGCIIQLLRKYCFGIADHCIIGHGEIKYQDRIVATFSYEDYSGFPVFDFIGEYTYLNQVQRDRRWEALKSMFGFPTYSTDFYKDCYYIGWIKYRRPFSSSHTRVEVYYDMDNGKIIAVREDGEVTFINFFHSISDNPSMEAEARRRAWAVLSTKIPDSEKRHKNSRKYNF